MEEQKFEKDTVEQTTKAKIDSVEDLGLLTIEDLGQLGLSPYSTINEIIKKLREMGYRE